MKKTLTAGYGGADAPSTRSGGGARVKEALDSKIKQLTWDDDDMDRLNLKKKKKKLKKSDLIKVREILVKRIDVEAEREKNKEFFKSILKKTKKSYPDLDMNEIVFIATEVMKKSRRPGSKDKQPRKKRSGSDYDTKGVYRAKKILGEIKDMLGDLAKYKEANDDNMIESLEAKIKTKYKELKSK